MVPAHDCNRDRDGDGGKNNGPEYGYPSTDCHICSERVIARPKILLKAMPKILPKAMPKPAAKSMPRPLQAKDGQGVSCVLHTTHDTTIYDLVYSNYSYGGSG